MQTRSRSAVPFLLLALALILMGCTSKTKTAENEKSEELTEAPLGSRIKRKSPSPEMQTTREQLEMQRAQQGAIRNGAVNDPGKAARMRQ